MKHHFSYFFRQGAGNMFTHGFMSFAAVGITVACLIIMGTFSLVAYNADIGLQELERENAVMAFVDDTLGEEQARALSRELESLPNVADCTFVTRKEARDDYIAKYDQDELYADLEASVFRHRFVLHLQDSALMSQTLEAVKAVPGIANARGDENISAGFVTVRNIAGVVSMALIAVLFIVSVFIISNTIKLTTFDRREEIAIMKMVGATNSFIRWPFVFEGLLLGLLGAVIAFVLQWVLYSGVSDAIVENDTLQLVKIADFREICLPVAGAFTLSGLLIGVGGSLLAIRKFLKV